MALVEPGTALTFSIVVCDTLAGVQRLEAISAQLEWTHNRLDQLMIRHAKVLITLAEIIYQNGG